MNFRDLMMKAVQAANSARVLLDTGDFAENINVQIN